MTLRDNDSSRAYAKDCVFANIAVTVAFQTFASALKNALVTLPDDKVVAGIAVMPAADCYVAAASDTELAAKQPAYAGVWQTMTWVTVLDDFGLVGTDTTALLRVYLN